jgi:hypothetical protein
MAPYPCSISNIDYNVSRPTALASIDLAARNVVPLGREYHKSSMVKHDLAALSSSSVGELVGVVDRGSFVRCISSATV